MEAGVYREGDKGKAMSKFKESVKSLGGVRTSC
jgi:hypothetical protein